MSAQEIRDGIDRTIRLYLDDSGSMADFNASDYIPVEATEIFLFDTEVHEQNSNRVFRGGGTDYNVVFAHLERFPTNKKVMIITDGYGPGIENLPKGVVFHVLNDRDRLPMGF